MLPPWAQRISDLLSADPSKTVTALARACGIAQPSVSNWFGKGTPTKMISGDNLIAAAAYLGVTPEYIMTGRDRIRSGDAEHSISSSNETRLDPVMLALTHQALRELYRDELHLPYNLEEDPERFLLVYEFQAKLSQTLPIADLIEVIKTVWLEKIQGAVADGRVGEGAHRLPVEGVHKGNVARRVQHKKG
jgi:transcriptional regulator with XRE-family HTH domain